MNKLISLNTVVSVAKQCARRFPITVGFIVMLTAYWLLMEWSDGRVISEKVDETVSYYLAVGTLLTIVLQLWGEEAEYRRTRVIINALSHAALLADSAYLYTIHGHYSLEVYLAHISVIMALALCMFILPFFREKDDIASWNFSLRLLQTGFSSWLTGCIMCGGICLLTAAVEHLFGISLSGNWTVTWCILFLHTLPALLFIGRIPDGAEKHDRTPRTSRFLHSSIRYLFLPLLGCYMVVLYGYLAKIVIEWQLPDGWVSKLVTVLTFGCIGIILGLYPSLRQGTSRSDSRMARLMPLAILPLLMLMTVGIVRRLGDYGVTVNRLYLLTLNIWFYLACAGLYLSRARRIWWISASFALFFLLTSALPVNISGFTRNWIYGRVETAIKGSYKGKLPMSEEAYLNWIAALPAEEARQVNSRLRYLDWDMSDKRKNALVSDSISWWKAESRIESSNGEAVEREYFSNGSKSDGYEIKLDGYATMLVYDDAQVTLSHIKGQKTLHVPISKGKQPADTLEISINDIRKWDALSNYQPRPIQCRRKGNRFILTSFSLRMPAKGKEIDFTFSGYYLMRK